MNNEIGKIGEIPLLWRGRGGKKHTFHVIARHEAIQKINYELKITNYVFYHKVTQSTSQSNTKEKIRIIILNQTNQSSDNKK